MAGLRSRSGVEVIAAGRKGVEGWVVGGCKPGTVAVRLVKED